MAGELDGRERGDRRPTVTPAPDLPGGLRVAFAPGTGRDGAPATIRVETGGSSAVDLAGRRASLEVGETPRARLTVVDGSHALLLTSLPDARRAAAGVQRVEVVIDGWRFEL